MWFVLVVLASSVGVPTTLGTARGGRIQSFEFWIPESLPKIPRCERKRLATALLGKSKKAVEARASVALFEIS